jgi:flagellar basal body-associated protein FliL
MAKEPEEKQEEQTEEKSGGGFGLFTWLILGAVVIAGSTGGFALSQLIGGQDEPAPVTQEDQAQDESLEEMFAPAEDQTPWPYESLKPVLANLDEPGVTRYVRVTIMIELSPEFDKVKGQTYLDTKTNDLRDWMYFAGLSLEDVRGTRNLSRIKKEVTDQFNELLFPDTKPFVQRVLFKEFAVQ